MSRFYDNWQQNGDKAKSLRQAMLEMIQQKRAPQHWAAFALIGEAD
jgi:CHAT domain-containing protein